MDSQSHKGTNIPLLLTGIYIFVNEATIYNRFPVLDSLGINKVLPISILLGFLLHASRVKTDSSSNKFAFLVIVLYFSMLLSFMFSDLKDTFPSQVWLRDYWQRVFLVWFIYLSINEKKDVRFFVILLVVFIGIYQILSWRDFLTGGSYVWQQGFKRMIGVWAGGSLGAANAYGFMGLFYFPLAYYLYLTSSSRKARILILGFLGMSVLSVFFSGTRTAVICLGLVFLAITYKKIFKFKIILLLAIIGVGIHNFLPDELKQRYLSSLYTTDSIDERALSIADESASSRLQGLIDGWELFKMSPLFGMGPGSSGLARTFVNEEYRQLFLLNGKYLQLHSLYGQLLAELGILGTVIFLSLCIICLKKLRKVVKTDNALDKNELGIVAASLVLVLLAMLTYGLASHNLYKIHWLIVFGLSCGIFKVHSQNLQKPL